MALSQKARKALQTALGKGAGDEVADAIEALAPPTKPSAVDVKPEAKDEPGEANEA